VWKKQYTLYAETNPTYNVTTFISGNKLYCDLYHAIRDTHVNGTISYKGEIDASNYTHIKREFKLFDFNVENNNEHNEYKAHKLKSAIHNANTGFIHVMNIIKIDVKQTKNRLIRYTLLSRVKMQALSIIMSSETCGLQNSSYLLNMLERQHHSA
jgi:hypothetical protein